MTRRVLLSLLGSVILFFWGFVGHVLIGLYDPVFHHFEDEAAVASVLEANARGAGIHYLPAEPARDGTQAEALINYVPAGQRSGFGAMVGRDLLIGAVAVFVVLTLLGGGSRSYWHSVGRFALTGFALGFVVHAYLWNWFDFPTLYFGLSVLDHVIGWTLVGLVATPLLNSPEDRTKV
jgi:hypothetical protein